MNSLIDQTYFLHYDQHSMQTSVDAQLKGFEAGAAWGSSYGSTTVDFSKHSFQWVTFYGGDAAMALTSQWSEWISSTKSDPTQISRNLAPISQFAPASLQSNLEKAIADYFANAPQQEPLPVSLQMRLEASSSLSQIYIDPGSSCKQYHGAAWLDYESLVYSARTGGYQWTVLPGYQTPPPIQTEISGSISGGSSLSCSSDSWICSIPKRSQSGCHDSSDCSGVSSYYYASGASCCRLVF